MDTQHGFDWKDSYLLGHAAMDQTHREFVERVNALALADDADLAPRLSAFIEHAEAHFEQENVWMLATEFPPRDCHIDEHNKVLASLHEVRQLLAQGNTPVVRELTSALIEWFPAHADYMDSALAVWLVKRTHGGRPLVFRRDGGLGA